MSLRIDGINATELGAKPGEKKEYQEQIADASRFNYAMEKKKSYPYKLPPAESMPKLKTTKTQRIRFSDNGINGILVADVDKAHSELARKYGWDPKKISYSDRLIINKLLSARLDFASVLAKLIRDDMLTWERSGTDLSEELYVSSQAYYYNAEKAPKQFCGTWQVYGPYNRLLGGLKKGEDFSAERFLRDRLPKLMEEKRAELLDRYEAKANKALRLSEGIENAAVAKAVREISSAPLEPRTIFSSTQTAKMLAVYKQLVEEHPEAEKNVQALLLVSGTLGYLSKYPNQYRLAYEKAHALAKKKGLGLHGIEPAFTAFWTANFGKASYQPLLCSMREEDEED